MMKKKHDKQIRSDLRDIFVEFLEASVHHILASRLIYPSSIFKKRLFGPIQFGVPVMVSEHPDVNDFITDGLTGLREILTNNDSLRLIKQFDLVIIQNVDDGREIVLETYMFQFEFSDSKDDVNIILQTKDVSELDQNIRAALLCLTSRLTELEKLKGEIEDSTQDYSFNFHLHTSNKGARVIADDFRWCKVPSIDDNAWSMERSFEAMETEDKVDEFSICDMVEEKSKQLSKPNTSDQEKGVEPGSSACNKVDKFLIEPTNEDLELLNAEKIDNPKVIIPVYSFSVPFRLKILIEKKE